MTSSNEIDWLGLAITGIVIIAPISQLAVPFGGMLGGFDPWKFILEDIVPPEIWEMWVTQIVYKIIATALLFIIMSETIRMFPMIILMVFLPVLTGIETIQMSMEYYQRCQSPKDFMNLHKIHTRHQIVNNNSMRYIPIEAFLLTACGAILACALNFAALKFYGRVPLGFYVLLVVGDAITLFAIAMILPFAIRLHENSSEALFLWKSQCGAKSKYLRRKFGALRSIRFYAGINGFNLFLYEKSVKVDYFAMIINNTINLLLSVPFSLIDSISFY